MKDKKILAIIPARGGSKRIPRKNIKDFLGKPIIAYSIEAALKSNLFDEIMVSTDDQEIAKVAKKYNAEVPFLRSEKNSDDYATTADVIEEVLLEYKKMGREYDYVYCIYPTAPFVTNEKLNESIKLFEGSDADSILPVVRFSYPIQRSLKIMNDGTLKMNWLKNMNARSQDLPLAYHDSGQFYCLDAKKFLVQKKILTNNTFPVIISESEVQDIDNEEDWQMAEMKYKIITQKNIKNDYFSIGKRKIGEGQPCFIIAEMSGNHNQDINKAFKIIDAIVDAGADAVKLQTYTADTITIDCNKEYFQVKVNDAWKGQTLYDLYKKAYTPWDWQPKLKEYAEKKGLVFFSTPFDNTAVDFLEKMNVALYKVASFEVVDIPLLERIGKTKKPVIMSRGMASVEEIELAVKTLKDNGSPQVAVLHCVSSYPAKPKEMNLATILDIRKRFNVITGLSDHTLGQEISIASVALGANIIEKHVTLSRAEGGTDAGFSLEPKELKELIKSIREVESAIGIPSYGKGEQESENYIFRKSLFVVKDIKKGEEFTDKNVRSIRPGYGLNPKYYHDVIGKKAIFDIEKGEPLNRTMFKK